VSDAKAFQSSALEFAKHSFEEKGTHAYHYRREIPFGSSAASLFEFYPTFDNFASHLKGLGPFLASNQVAAGSKATLPAITSIGPISDEVVTVLKSLGPGQVRSFVPKYDELLLGDDASNGVFGFLRSSAKMNFMARVEFKAKSDADLKAALSATVTSTFEEDYVGGFLIIPRADHSDGLHFTVLEIFDDSASFAKHVAHVKADGTLDGFFAAKDELDGVFYGDSTDDASKELLSSWNITPFKTGEVHNSDTKSATGFIKSN
jgi:quinol monooxygenase YgiN